MDSDVQPTSVPAGWYPDPASANQLRYWDGHIWTEAVHQAQPSPDDPVPNAPGDAPKRRTYKTALAVIGTSFVMLMLLTASCAIPLAIEGSRVDRESRAYVDRVLPAILSDWNQSALVDEASPEFLEASSDVELDKLFGVYRKMGKLESLGEPRGSGRVMHYIGKPTGITATYHYEAQFENGPAVIGVTVIKHGDKWQIAGFNLNSDVFLDDL